MLVVLLLLCWTDVEVLQVITILACLEVDDVVEALLVAESSNTNFIVCDGLLVETPPVEEQSQQKKSSQ